MPRRREWKGKDKRTYRSELEMRVANALWDANILYDYETVVIRYQVRASKHQCDNCKSNVVSKLGDYLTDFYLPEFNFYIETKGRFTGTDRRKMEAVIKQHPDLDIRMLFPSDNWISKQHKQRYSDWCEKKGITYVIGKVVPKEWLEN